MGKGFIVLLGVGAVFAYFVSNFVHSIEEDDPNSYSTNEQKAKEYAIYYSKDAIGDLVLDFSNASVETAKKVWAESPIKEDILNLFPNFDTIRSSVENRLKESKFKTYLLKKIGEIEDGFLGGDIDSETAKKMISDP